MRGVDGRRAAATGHPAAAAGCATLSPVSVTGAPRQDNGGSVPEAGEGIDAETLARVTGGQLLQRSPRRARGAAVDSRRLRPGNVFVALPGSRTDGHQFLTQAVAAGAAALLVTRPPVDPRALGDVTVVMVDDGLAALHRLAAWWRSRFDPVVVGVTGSFAKTSTKEAIAAVLAPHRVVLKSPGNENNEIGLPLAVLELDEGHQVAVLEMGMYVGGEIRDLCRIARPRVGVVTAVGPVHAARAGSLEAIEAAKAELVDALPSDGTAVLNGDDLRVRRMAGRARGRVVLYGFGPRVDVTAEEVEGSGWEGMRFRLRLGGEGWPVHLPMLGRLAVQNALAAAAVAWVLGLDGEAIAHGLGAGWPVPRRGEVHRIGGIALIDDSYNASPGSVTAALEMLSGLPGRRVAILGEMLELGPYHDEGHRQVGEAAARTVDLLCVVGGAGPAAPLVEAALQSGLSAEAVVVADDAEGARRLMEPLLQPGDVVLIKASRGVGLDRLVDALRADLAAREDSSPAAQDGGFPAARQAGSLAGRQASSSSGAGGGGEGTAG